MDRGEQFWDEAYDEFKPYDIDESNFGKENEYFLNKIGNVSGLKLLDIGCGNGDFSMYFARRGAIVTAIDISQNAVRNTLINAEFNGVKVEAYKVEAMDIANLNKEFDLITGKFILHHIEPFNEFVNILYQLLLPNGRGIFYENNARNFILMLARKFLVGRFGIPKYGDEVEYPFEVRELNMMKHKFNLLKLHYPQLRFFSLLAPYIFKDNEIINQTTRAIDRFFYKYMPFFNRYSYIQIIEVFK